MSLRFGDQGHGGDGLILGNQTAFASAADIFGTGVLLAQAASMTGTGTRGSQDLGTPPEIYSGLSTVAGVGEVIHVGSGVLQADEAVVTGVGADFDFITGTGVLQVSAASLVGSGFIGIGGTGTLLAQRATVVGSGAQSGTVFGAGVLLAQTSAVTGAGYRRVRGAGNMAAQVASAYGLGTVVNIAVDYVCYLPPQPIMLETLSVRSSYSLQFNNPRNVPNSITVGWDDLVTKFAGVEPDTEVAYRFSNGKEFKEDQN